MAVFILVEKKIEAVSVGGRASMVICNELQLLTLRESARVNWAKTEVEQVDDYLRPGEVLGKEVTTMTKLSDVRAGSRAEAWLSLATDDDYADDIENHRRYWGGLDTTTIQLGSAYGFRQECKKILGA